ncbi:hypothetical protein HBI56_202390 [Parastagonospora nodorum]|uniref:Uncharacterized protein n=1 Tax=Phaeosphaeria nodorum (strain SN15 / ATCC MYA-4574 / FGSC 10173) TaxID=321614 RepID=A0A7U2FAJ7_PHANO|nr:hypothetical protein HBH56_143670 [Parastagonospora nodorum]QRD01468.1 hypothetical protein JI435_416730 [Parastagonospora nodorum SN15]KAH3927734.1 hypothetical protein HBH54_148860 [Parastagonospora nodorum]KAH3947959.1 hypothetical protein HBH53_108910 [Parastagonospora nodorum]KAH4020455.1 hypothetical protein HBI13_115090 [Parastagonospora nodorum]
MTVTNQYHYSVQVTAGVIYGTCSSACCSTLGGGMTASPLFDWRATFDLKSQTGTQRGKGKVAGDPKSPSKGKVDFPYNANHYKKLSKTNRTLSLWLISKSD